MTLQDKLNLVTNYFAEDWAIGKAMQLLEDYEKMVEAQQPAPSAAATDWWRKRADEIEAQVAATGSTEAMRCYTDMRTLLQARMFT